jgi:hypothetical protein
VDARPVNDLLIGLDEGLGPISPAKRDAFVMFDEERCPDQENAIGRREAQSFNGETSRGVERAKAIWPSS